MTDTPESTLAAGVPETSTEPEPTTQATVPTTTVQGNVNSSTSTEATSTTAAPATATTTAEAPTTNTTNTSTPEENTVVTAPAPAAEPAPSATSASTPSSTTNTTQALSPTTGKPASPEASASTPSSTTNTAQVLSPTTATPAVTPDPEPVVVLDDKQQTCQNRFSQEVKDTTIQFSVNKAVITPGSYPLLDTLATIAKECAGTLGNLKVEVGGHTDSDGNDKYNQQLSEQRAGAVKQYLVKKGVATTLLTVKGYGESRPVASNLTAEGRAQNRRIEFKLK
nr:OmpA family protein [Thiofilum flexile]